MKTLIQRIGNRVLGWLRRMRRSEEEAPFAPPAPPPLLGHNLPPKPTRREVAKKTEQAGVFFYLRDVLDQLDQLELMVRRLKTHHRSAYEYHKRVGARVVPNWFLHGRLSERFLEQRPANGMTLLFQPKGDAVRDHDYFPGLLYFEKLKQPHYVQRARGDIYRCVDIFYVAEPPSDAPPRKTKPGYYGMTFFMALDADGKGTLLRELQTHQQKLPRRGGTIQHRDWRWSEDFEWWFRNRDPERKSKVFKADTIEEYAWEIFCVVANAAVTRPDDPSGELLVRCTRRAVTTAFSVSTKRTPYFFRDRETTVAKDGRRKRIFHIVAEHERRLRSGRVVTVPEHYRGERFFQWNGWGVRIAAPKTQDWIYHPVEGEEYDGPEHLADGVPADVVGASIADALDSGRASQIRATLDSR